MLVVGVHGVLAHPIPRLETRSAICIRPQQVAAPGIILLRIMYGLQAKEYTRRHSLLLMDVSNGQFTRL